ncbi:hypothetical protein CORC01_08257 [Colletotrichum orchidophilum]|uniref:FAD dependent oxidoreductase n=1 Tax=Colletotrichum orchidophilum TaxID=1209926 RepID=A0A1G4B515_9PEZI|nr:uncharacterized protein CORC01_08257 [Colletotrichum orchidophilum]OHE96494.1 hypothetical protein CORC01_08257 [Colletotrichum orchidophilum]
MVLGRILSFAVAATAAATNYGSTVFDTDVVIIGGGGSGAYAAVRLREDFGKQILVVEKTSRLGGHTQTWYDPATNKPFNYGVEAFTNISASVNFFARFNVSVKRPEWGQAQRLYADFRNGEVLNYTTPSSDDVTSAMAKYGEQWNRYADLLLPTSFGFPTGDDIPVDLLLPWNEFAKKYHLEAVSPTIWSTVGVDLTKALMIDVWKSYYPTVTGFAPASGDNSEIWHRVEELLGKDVMYESQVISTERSDNGVRLRVMGRDGAISQINAKRLLISIGPETMAKEVFSLDDHEVEVLSSTSGNRYYTGLVSHPSLPPQVIVNTAPEGVGANYLAYPATPYLASFLYKGNSSAGPIYRSLVIASKETGFEDAKSIVRNSLQKLMDAGTVVQGDVSKIDFKTFDDHGMLYRRWDAEQLRGGIVSQANALQGLRSTWYTGAYWMNNNAAMLWNTTDAILPKMLVGF